MTDVENRVERRKLFHVTSWLIIALLIIALLSVIGLVVVDIVRGDERAERLDQLEVLVADVRSSIDETLANREQGLRNRRAQLCVGRGLIVGVDGWDERYLQDVCHLSADEARFVLGLVDTLPDP
jgi:hypothetical protein